MATSSESVLSSHAEKWEGSPCPYCGSPMREGACPNCGRICPRCGTPSKEPTCPQCGFGSLIDGLSQTGSPAPAQSPEFSDVQRILGRTPSRREFNMVRGMIDKDRERIHRLTELLCEKVPTPLSRELVEMRATQVRNRARKSGTELTHAESVVYAFMEAAKHSGVVDYATKALAEAQLLDSNLRLGLSKARLPPLAFVVEVSGSEGVEPILLVDGEPRTCKKVLMETRPHSRTYMVVWRPYLADCLEDAAGSRERRVSACLESKNERTALLIASEEKSTDKRWYVDVQLNMRRFFYGFTTRKEVEVDVGLSTSCTVDSKELALRRLAKLLDSLRTTSVLFGLVGAGSPSFALWSQARSILSGLRDSEFSVTPRRKAAASILAADMKRFAKLEPTMRANLVFSSQTIPMSPQDAEYACARGLIVPSEFSPLVGMDWNDILSLAVKM
jgi:hypothetical protein